MIKDRGNLVEAQRCLRTAIDVARRQGPGSLNSALRSVVAIVLNRIPISRLVPIIVSEKRVTQYARIEQCELHPLSLGGIASRRGVADQCDAVRIRVFHPSVRAIKRSQRPCHLCLGIQSCRNATLH